MFVCLCARRLCNAICMRGIASGCEFLAGKKNGIKLIFSVSIMNFVSCETYDDERLLSAIWNGQPMLCSNMAKTA